MAQKKVPIKIRASGFPFNIKFELVKEFCEKFGELENIIYEPNNNCFRFAFVDPKVTESFINEVHFYNGRHLRVTWLPKRPQDSATSQIPEIPEVTSEDILTGIKNIPNFDTQVKTLQEKLQQHNAKLQVLRKIILEDLASALVPSFRNCAVFHFGSSITKLDYYGSDLDVYVSNVRNPVDPEMASLKRIKNLIYRSRKFCDILIISHARVPIIKCIHTTTHMCVDLNIQNMLGVYNSQLIQYYLSLDPKLQPLMLFIKYWCDVVGLKKVNFFSSYSLCMMFIFYLQQEPYNLPSVHELQVGKAPNFCEGWNCAFDESKELTISPALKDGKLKDIFEGFLSFYSNFDYFSLAICPFLGRPLKKIDFLPPENLPKELDIYARNVEGVFDVKRTLCIQDPIQLSRNVTAVIAPPTVCKLVGTFQLTLEKLKRSSDNFVHRILSDYSQPPVPTLSELDLGELGPNETRKSWEKSFSEHFKKFLMEIMLCTVEDAKQAKKKPASDFKYHCAGNYDFLVGRTQILKNVKGNLPPDATEYDLEVAASAYIGKYVKNQPMMLRFGTTLTFPKAETKKAKVAIFLMKKCKTISNVIQFCRIKIPALFLSSQNAKLLDSDTISKAVDASCPKVEKVSSSSVVSSDVKIPEVTNSVKVEVPKENVEQGVPTNKNNQPEKVPPSKGDSPAKEEKPTMVCDDTTKNTKTEPPQPQTNENLNNNIQNDDLPTKVLQKTDEPSPDEEKKEKNPELPEENTEPAIEIEDDAKGEDEEEEDIPDDFFDDFANEDFMEGLDIVDAWDDDPGKPREPADKDDPALVLDISCSPVESLFDSAKSPEKKTTNKMRPPSPRRTRDNKRKRSKSPIRWRKSSTPRDLRFKVAENRSFNSTPTRRDPEKTKRDIGRDKVKCAKDKEQKIVSDKLKLVETGLVPPGMELEVDLPKISQPKVMKRSTERIRERRSPLISPERERKIRRRSGSRDIKRSNHGMLYTTVSSRSPPVYRPRPREKEFVRVRRRSSSMNSNDSSDRDRDWGRDKHSSRKRSRSKEAQLRKKIRKYKEKEASKKKSFLEEIAEKLNEVRPVQVSVPRPAPQYAQIRPGFPNPVPAPVPAPSYYPANPAVRMVQPPPQYDQQYFIGGDAYSMMQKNTMAAFATGMMPQGACLIGHPQTQYAMPPPSVVQTPQQYTLPLIQMNIPDKVQPPVPSPNKPAATSTTVKEAKLNSADVDKLFADKKISLSDFLTITAKPEVHSSTPEHLQKKIKVISRCQDAIKVLSDDRRITGRLHVKSVQDEAAAKLDTKYQSPLRRIPIVRFQFTTPTKTSEEVDTFGVALDKVLHKLGILKSEEVINLDPPVKSAGNVKSSFADDSALALTLKASLLSAPNLKSPVRAIVLKSPPPCEECKLRKLKISTEVSTQCEDTTKEMISISTQVTEEDLKPKTGSIAQMTPAQLLGKSKESETKVEKVNVPEKKPSLLPNPVQEKPQQKHPIPAKAAAANKPNPKKAEKPSGRGRGGRFDPYNTNRNPYPGFGRGGRPVPQVPHYSDTNRWNENSNYVDFNDVYYDEFGRYEPRPRY